MGDLLVVIALPLAAGVILVALPDIEAALLGRASKVSIGADAIVVTADSLQRGGGGGTEGKRC